MISYTQNGHSFHAVNRLGLQFPSGVREKHLHIVLGVGGASEAFLLLASMHPSLVDACAVYDTDSGQIDRLPQFPRRYHLHCDGDFRTVLENRDRYAYLRGNAVPADLSATDTDDGVGMLRATATVVFGHNLAEVKMSLRRLIEDRLHAAKGANPKKLICHLVYSNCGGTGSSLAVKLALLTRDAARAVNHSLNVVLVAHCISPQAYFSRWVTPGEQILGMANAYQTLCEQYFSQRPENVRELARALEIAPPLDLLLNHFYYYDLSTSGDAVQSLSEIRERIAVNIAGSQYAALFQADASKAINPSTIQRISERDDAGTAIAGGLSTAILQLPVFELACAFANQTLIRQCDRALASADPARVQGLLATTISLLELDQTRHAIEEGLHDPSFLMAASVESMTNEEVLQRSRKVEGYWTASGPQRLDQRVRDLAPGLERGVQKRCAAFLDQLASQSEHCTEMRTALQQTLDVLEERKRKMERELEILARENSEANFRRARDRVQNREVWLFGRRRARLDLQKSWNRVPEARTRRTALQVERDQVLTPLAALLRRGLETVESTAAYLAQVRQQLEQQSRQLQESITYQTKYFTHLLRTDEVAPVLERLRTALATEYGPSEPLPLARLLREQQESERVHLLEELGARLRHQVFAYLEQRVTNVVRFVSQFGLQFDLVGWVRRHLEFTLPCKLNLAPYGPADAPTKLSILASRSVFQALEKEVALPGDDSQVEADDEFAIVIKASITKAPFRTLPGLPEAKRYHEYYRASRTFAHAPSPLSHGSLRGANDIDLLANPQLVPANATMNHTSKGPAREPESKETTDHEASEELIPAN